MFTKFDYRYKFILCGNKGADLFNLAHLNAVTTVSL
jgi:hypothetical protein